MLIKYDKVELNKVINNSQKETEEDPNQVLDGYHENSAYMEVTKEQVNGLRYLFTSFNRCFNLFEINSNEISHLSNITNQIDENLVTSVCDNEWIQLQDPSIGINPTLNIVLNMNSFFRNRISGFRGEMDLIQIDDKIKIGIPFHAEVSFWSSGTIVGVVKTVEVNGVEVFDFSLNNGVPTFSKEELVGIDFPLYTTKTFFSWPRRIVKGIEFNDNGDFYVSSILLNYNLNEKSTQPNALLFPTAILSFFKYNSITQCYNNFRPKPLINLDLLSAPMSHFDDFLNEDCDINRVGSLNINSIYQYGFGQIERDNMNRLLITSENGLKALSDINNPNSTINDIIFPINQVV